MMPLHSETSAMGMDGMGMPVGTLPTTRTPRSARSKEEDARMPPTSTSSDQGTRGARREPAKRMASEVEPQDEGQAVEVGDPAHEGEEALEEPADGGREPGEGGDLADDDEHDEARDEARDDGLAEELGDPAQAQEADRDEDGAGGDGEDGGELDRELGVTASEPADDRTGEHRDRRDGSDEEQAGGAEDGVGEQGGRQGVEADLDGDVGDDGVAERLGYRESGDEQARHEVGREVPARVPPQQPEPWWEARAGEVHDPSLPSPGAWRAVLGMPGDGRSVRRALWTTRVARSARLASVSVRADEGRPGKGRMTVLVTSPRRHLRMPFAAALAVGAVVLAGCQSDAEPPVDRSSAASVTPSASPSSSSPTASPSPSVEIPAAAREKSEKGAEAFVRYFFDQVECRLDEAPIRHSSRRSQRPDCEFCDKTEQHSDVPCRVSEQRYRARPR